ncbi:MULTISPECIES: hypothetical protein [Nonomuraea]|uniref:Uncharacterized protein n=1 Tax=Nonomuraea ferruginea TaxID=46174 RepID=A0ABT4T0D5_9ACTN|nr:hypothetical protein [Nonomuraea ferruginea]MDA0642954.1 hypothetical protein [Nonomuraea ferruginea]
MSFRNPRMAPITWPTSPAPAVIGAVEDWDRAIGADCDPGLDLLQIGPAVLGMAELGPGQAGVGPERLSHRPVSGRVYFAKCRLITNRWI